MQTQAVWLEFLLWHQPHTMPEPSRANPSATQNTSGSLFLLPSTHSSVWNSHRHLGRSGWKGPGGGDTEGPSRDPPQMATQPQHMEGGRRGAEGMWLMSAPGVDFQNGLQTLSSEKGPANRENLNSHQELW